MARILVVDDEPYARRYMRRVLERAGHQVQDAGDSQQALASLRATAVDLVITDLIMPHGRGIDGITTCRKEFPAIKIIAISAVAAYLTVAKRVGAHAALEKPFNNRILLDTVDIVLTTPS